MHRFCWTVLLSLVATSSLGCAGGETDSSPEGAAKTNTTAPTVTLGSETPNSPAATPNQGDAVSSLKIAKDHVVAMEYKLTGPDGNVIDTSEGRAPLYYLHGAGNIIPGLENALAGKAEGDKMTVTIPAADAYGERDEELIQDVPREDFANVPGLKAGMDLEAQTPQGPARLRVLEVGEKMVKIDMNHELAGIPLTFAVTVVKVRTATPEELTHGHVHGPGGANH